MALALGTRLGPYEIASQIGMGGMGEVYRATDTNLKRQVAIKVLPDAVATDGERLARFQREAEVLASLNHPNIAAIHGLERADGQTALVMELVEGPTLADRIAQGPIPLDEVLPIARQIAEALEAAHEQGIVHRDLKPANVKVRPDGTVKVLDFGLAKAMEPSVVTAAGVSLSPTITSPAMTMAGVILGTAAYMSPEQARGNAVDKRSDVWAFGCVMFEMLTGTRAFDGATVSDTLASVLKEEPDLQRAPESMRRLLRSCLEKNAKQRLQAIADWRLLLDDGPAASAPPRPSRARSLPWIAAAALSAAMAGTSVWAWMGPARPEARLVTRFTTSLPPGPPSLGMAVSDDGSLIAVVGGAQRQIYVRPLDSLEARPLPRTDGAGFLAFSPDGRWISFTDNKGRLQKVPLAGGPSQLIAEGLNEVGPPTHRWADNDSILLTKGELLRVPADRGTPHVLATPDANKGERFFVGPQLLLDGQSVFVSLRTPAPAGPPGSPGTSAPGSTRTFALDPQTGQRTLLLEAPGEIVPQFVADPASRTGYLVYFEPVSGSVMAVSFDPTRLRVRGSPVPVVMDVRPVVGPFGSFGVSQSGTLAFVRGITAVPASSLVWVDRKGMEWPLSVEPRPYYGLRLSSDGQYASMVAVEGTGLNPRRDFWLYDTARERLERRTFSGFDSSAFAIWSREERRRWIYRSFNVGDRRMELRAVPADSKGDSSVLASDERDSALGRFIPTSASPDGTRIIGIRAASPTLPGTMWVLTVSSGPSTENDIQPFHESSASVLDPQFSPNGRWVAFQSSDLGRDEIFVVDYPGPGILRQASTNGGSTPRWSQSGRELFFANGSTMMAVDVEAGLTFRAGTPREVFERPHQIGNYDVAPDGRFLLLKPVANDGGELQIVVNWLEELKRLVPTK